MEISDMKAFYTELKGSSKELLWSLSFFPQWQNLAKLEVDSAIFNVF